jgi:RNA polymerase subunit RPABC4/transcription elongation factor Spt4
MGCAIHPEEETIGICVQCGKAVCLECRTILGEKVYCPVCAAKVYEKDAGKRTWKPIVGGVLGIIAGVINFSVGIVLIVEGAAYDQSSESVNWSEMGGGEVLVILGIIAIIGSSLAIARRNFLISVIGGVCALPPILLGIPALILIARSRDEFEPSGTGSVCTGCGRVNPKGATFCMVCGHELPGHRRGV